jgi:hypothetical protein
MARRTNAARRCSEAEAPPLDSGIRTIEIACAMPGCAGMARAPKDSVSTRFCAQCQALMRRFRDEEYEATGRRPYDREVVAWMLRDCECSWCGGNGRNNRSPVTVDEDNDPICRKCASAPGPKE